MLQWLRLLVVFYQYYWLYSTRSYRSDLPNGKVLTRRMPLSESSQCFRHFVLSHLLIKIYCFDAHLISLGSKVPCFFSKKFAPREFMACICEDFCPGLHRLSVNTLRNCSGKLDSCWKRMASCRQSER